MLRVWTHDDRPQAGRYFWAVVLSAGTQATTAERTSETEYVAMSEIVQEVLFVRQVQAFIMPSFESN